MKPAPALPAPRRDRARPPRRTLLLAAAALFTLPLGAQEGPVTFEFSFANPGARSLGLGGAFAALADDATAAFANPAGLVQLLEPEVSLEGRATSYEVPFVQGGRANGTPTGEGLDTTAGLRIGTSSSDQAGLGFVSVVLPWKRFSFALYRHTWADFQLSSEVNGLFGEIDGEVERSEDVEADTDVRIVNFGLAAAVELTSTLSLGLGVVRSEGDLTSFTTEFGVEDEQFFEENPFTPDLVDTTYDYRGSTSDLVLHGGLLWRPSPRWSLGLFYREGPVLDLRVVEITGPADDDSPPGTVDLDTTTHFALPDVWGAGVAYRTPDDRWTFGFEWARVGYSSITESLDTEVLDPDQVALDDGDELHLGIEYVARVRSPIVALRVGAWRDPAHAIGSGPEAELFERIIFQSGDDEIHVAAGVGLVFDLIQVDLGVDLSDTANTFSLSFVYGF